MGIIEERVRVRARKNYIKEVVLETVKTAGILSVALVAPNVLGALKKIGLLPRSGKKAIKRTFFKLLDDGSLQYEDPVTKKGVKLSPYGEQVLNRLLVRELAERKPKKWDGKFRMLVFDIKERRRDDRDQMREMLKQVGFIQLQRSVWVYPYDCEDFIILLKAYHELGTSMLYVVAEEIEFDKPLRAMFNLPSSRK